MTWIWRRKRKGWNNGAPQQAATEADHKAQQAREVRMASEAKAEAEWKFLGPKLATPDDVIADRIEERLRRGRR